jgi:methylthioribose-1-phosphate isomerase
VAGAAGDCEEVMETLAWVDDHLRLLDQTRLPGEEVYVDLHEYRQVAAAIRTMQIRGAPALGCAGAYGVALAARALEHLPPAEFQTALDAACEELIATRPTAVNLSWAIRRLQAVAGRHADPHDAAAALLDAALRVQEEDVRANRALGRWGQALLPDAATVLTHCNAGLLATAGYGTALGVIRAAVEAGKDVQVFADETRPLLQGARLTAWELAQDGIPTTLIADTMAGYFLRQGRITCVIVGADRIAANGDVINKIGTYQVAVLANENGVPFYVAAPTSTIDLDVANGDAVSIEQRSAEEVRGFAGVRTAPAGIAVENPAFDVTPQRYVSAIITERGIVRAPYTEHLAALLAERGAANAVLPLPFKGRGPGG